MSWQLALGVLVIVPPVFFASRWFRRVSNKAYLDVRDRISTNLTTLQEGLEGVRVVQAFGRSDSFTERFEATNEDQYEANMETDSHLGEVLPVHRVRGRRRHRGDHRLRRLALDRSGVVDGRHGRRVRAVPPAAVRADQPAQPALQHGAVGGRGAAQDLRRARHAGRRSRRRRARSTCRGRARSTSTHVTFAYGTNDPVLHDVSLHIAAGERHRARRPDRRREVDAGQAHRAVLRPGRGRGARRRRRPARRDDASRCATASSSCRRKASCSRARCATTCASAGPKPPTPRSRPRSSALGLLDRFRAFPEGLDTEVRERGSRLVGRGAPARLARARRARRPVGARSSTKRRRTSTPAPSTRSSRRWRR